ncbi:rootletin [Aspergillus terreus]|uniref:Rootletin n=1 Tax=Aspergillus terreus TaxID=33178 RepID=A0A5M3Z6V0_ASPTE|nr:hypothetical protein ATETN484_0010044200 [Aspergillus terreus]GFF18489.1 rootletin [Aspergillus terreus]
MSTGIQDSEILEGSCVRGPKKRRRTSGRKASSNSVVPADSDTQMTEEALFQVLISRMKEREEKEAAALDAREELEGKLSILVEENQVLRRQLEAMAIRLQKKIAESKLYRSQIDGWNTRVANFKGLLNEVGSDYETLRSEVVHLKTSKESLAGDSREISTEIEDLRSQVSNVTNTMSEVRSGIAKSRDSINSLQLALTSEEAKCASVQVQLSDEKKRVLSLEAYIRETSNAQSAVLSCLRADQLNLVKKLDSALESMNKRLEVSHTSTKSVLENALKECLESLSHMNEEYTEGKIDIQKYNETFQEAATRMEEATLTLAAELRTGSETNRNLSTELRSQLQRVKDEIGPGSTLSEQLTTTKTSCTSLGDNLNISLSRVEQLDKSIKDAQDREHNLMEQMGHLQEKLSEFKALPDREEEDNYASTSKQVELEDRLKLMSTELADSVNNVQTKEDEITQLNVALLEATGRLHDAETRANQAETEVTGLQERVKSIEVEVRAELTRASVISRDQIKAKYEQNLHELLREKTEACSAVEAMANKLLAVEKSLVSTPVLPPPMILANYIQVESEETWGKRMKELEELIAEKERQIQHMDSQCTEKEQKLVEKDAEIKRLQDEEAVRTAEKTSLLQLLNAANEEVLSLESKLSMLNTDTKEEPQRRLATLQSDILKKEEEYNKICSELSAANLECSKLESGKTKAKAEIYALLRRVQDSEAWLKKIRESMCQNGMMSPEQPFSEVWGKLESLLNSSSKVQLKSPGHDNLVAFPNIGGLSKYAHSEFTEMLLLTPEEKEIGKTTSAEGKAELVGRPVIPLAKEHVDIVPSTQRTEEGNAEVQTCEKSRLDPGSLDKPEIPACKIKAVTFEMEDQGTPAAECKAEEPGHGIDSGTSKKPSGARKSTRTNQRTYNKSNKIGVWQQQDAIRE